jgi:sugar phosphate isomerase/epimerase
MKHTQPIMMQVSVYTVMVPDLTPEEAVQALSTAGYDGVEWRVTDVPEEWRDGTPSFWGNNLCTLAPTEAEARRARSLAESAGLAIPSLGTYIAMGDLAATEEAMHFARIAGAPQIRVGAGSSQGAPYAGRFAAAKAFLAEVEPLALHYGIRALVEIHHGTICPSASLAHRLVSHFDPQAVGVIYDPGNMAREGFEGYRLGIELLGPYLAHVHLKNAAFTRPEGGGAWTARWAPLEDGVVDFPQVLAALQAVGYDGWLSAEDFSAARPCREALRHNLAFIRDAIARVSGQSGGGDG